jgi:ubiquinone/menaquinone biosynthesis C-methylase UbiE
MTQQRGQAMQNTNFNNPDHLKEQQYRRSDKLSARIRLHQNYSTTNESPITGTFDFMLEYVPQQAKILELGTGRGDLWKDNAERIPAAWDMTLTDLSAGMIHDQQIYLGDLARRMNYRVVNAVDIPYADNSFDVVVANYMLYHVPDRAKTIAEIQRVLKPDGVLFAATNGMNHMKMIFTIAQAVEEVVREESWVAETFSLQNGTAQLMQSFTDIRMIRFNNNLWIPEAQPIIDYIESMLSIDGEDIIRAHETAIRANLNQIIADKGGILIEKETGLFIARGIYDKRTQSGN